MAGSSGPERTTSTTEPPAFIRPFLEYGAGQSRSLYETGGPQYYPGQTVVPFAPQTEQALGLTAQRALSGSGVGNAAQDYSTQALQGNFLPGQAGGNPYLDSTFDLAARRTQNQLASEFAGSGRNIGAAMPARADQLNDLATQIYGGAYDAERGRQQQSAFLAPQLANLDYQDLAALEGVGGRIEDLSGQYIDDAASRFNFEQNAPQINLDNYLARITGSFPGGTTTSSTPTSRNRGAGALGGAASGAAIGSAFPGIGTGVGAIAGGLLGYFGS